MRNLLAFIGGLVLVTILAAVFLAPVLVQLFQMR